MRSTAYFQLWGHISGKRRNQLKLLLVVMVMASISEVVSIGAILPFLGALMSPEHVFSAEYLKPVIDIFGIGAPDELLFPLTFFFVLASLISGLMRLLLIWGQTRVGFAIGSDLSSKIYRNVLYQPYSVHIFQNSSQVVAAVTTKTNVVIEKILLPILRVFSSIIILLAIMAVLIYIDLELAFTAFFIFTVIYAVIALCTKKSLLNHGKKISYESSQVVKALQEGVGGIRDVLVDGIQDKFCQIYRQADSPLRRSQANIQIIGGMPRFLIEAFAMASIAVIAYFLVRAGRELISIVPVLGSLALGAQRMLPVIQQLYYSWTSMRGAHSSLEDVLKFLDQEPSIFLVKADVPELCFNKSIQLDQVSYRYGKNLDPVLRNLSIEIPKGSRVGIIGSTGSGKSTLIDLLMGLLPPSDGFILIDGVPLEGANYRSWQKRIAHVPQTIFLTDNTIAHNIAFGVPQDKIDYDLVREVACRAQIAETIESMPLKYETIVGERGISLSGGQKQRIGIARALYKNADIIFFDEATSALDDETEKLVIQAIESLDESVTVVMVAHRLTTITQCNLILELNRGELKQVNKTTISP